MAGSLTRPADRERVPATTECGSQEWATTRTHRRRYRRTGGSSAQLVRQIPATPGRIGVIEASLILALGAAGAGQAPAAAAVLIYRLLSCWTVLPIGLLCWTAPKSPIPPRPALSSNS